MRRAPVAVRQHTRRSATEKRGGGRLQSGRWPADLVRACAEIRFWVAQATGLYRPATRRAEREARPEAIRTGLLKEAASIFRSASRRPERASRPCYPFSGHALSNTRLSVLTS